MTESSSEQQPNVVTSKRTFLKCSQCRKDRKRCEPQKGDWNNGEKCQRCSHSGYPCGPRQSKIRRLRSENNFQKTYLMPPPLCPAPMSPYSFSSGDERCKHRPFRAPQVLTSTDSNIVISARSVYLPSNSGIVTLDAIKDFLAVSLAIRKIWLRCEVDIRGLDEKSGCPWNLDRIRQFQKTAVLLRDEFDRLIKKTLRQLASLPITKRRQRERELQSWLDRDGMLQFQKQLMSRSRVSCLPEESDIFAPVVDSTFHDFEVLLCTEDLLVNKTSACTDPAIQNVGFIKKPRPQDYIKAATTIEDCLRWVSGNPSNCLNCTNCMRPTCTEVSLAPRHQHSFPASHIAYWNRDKSTANLLWKDSLATGDQTDIFGRTYAHIAAQAGDLETLRYIGQESNKDEAIRNAGRDLQGRSLLDIAAVLGNQDVFTICFDRGADSGPLQGPSGQSVLDLAVYGGNTTIVRKILKNGMVLPPYTQAMKTAIMLGYEEVAQCILFWIREDVWHDRVTILTLANLAHYRQLREIESQLHKICSPESNCMENMNDMEAQYGPTLPPADSQSLEEMRQECFEPLSSYDDSSTPSTQSSSDDEAHDQDYGYQEASEL